MIEYSGFLPRTSGAERIRGYKIVKEIVRIVNHAQNWNFWLE